MKSIISINFHFTVYVHDWSILYNFSNILEEFYL